MGLSVKFVQRFKLNRPELKIPHMAGQVRLSRLTPCWRVLNPAMSFICADYYPVRSTEHALAVTDYEEIYRAGQGQLR